MPLRPKPLHLPSILSLSLTAILLLAGSLHAQMGVAPSQTGMFFNDIRIRAEQVRTGMANQANPAGSAMGVEGVYTFDESQYTGQPIDQRALGNPMGFDAIARQIGTPFAAGPGPTSYSRRLAGDHSGYNGPYPSTNTFFAPTYISDPFLAGRRNLKLGPVNIGLGLTGALEYNDNVLRASTFRAPTTTPAPTLSTSSTSAINSNPLTSTTAAAAAFGKVSDFIGSAYVNIDANYAISQYNRITLTASVGVSQYFNHPELAQTPNGFNLTVLPGTSLAFDVKVGNMVFVLYDRMSVQPASRDAFALDNNDVFGSFQNDAGIGMNWAINSEWNLSLNFNRSDSIALQDFYKRYDRTVNSLSGSLAWTPMGTWTVGLESSVSRVDYRENFNNDGKTFSGGVFVIVPVTHNTIVRVAGGFQKFEFDLPPVFTRTVSDQDLTTTQATITSLNDQIAAINVNAATPAAAQAAQAQLASLQAQLTQAQTALTQQSATKSSEDTTFNSRSFDRTSSMNDYYYNVVISNQLNARIAQQLSFGHESSLNNTSNIVTADYLSYGIGIIAWRGSRFTVSGFYENADESGGNLREDTKQYGFDVNWTHRLSEFLTGAVGYHYGNTDSKLINRDYEQHSFTVNLSYQLNTKWNVGLGYQLWKTDAEDPTQTFTQNRIILSTNYNF